jgi:hypothetical protein
VTRAANAAGLIIVPNPFWGPLNTRGRFLWSGRAAATLSNDVRQHGTHYEARLKHECRPGGLTGTVTQNVMRVHRKLQLRIIVIWRVSVKIMLIR